MQDYTFSLLRQLHFNILEYLSAVLTKWITVLSTGIMSILTRFSIVFVQLFAKPRD